MKNFRKTKYGARKVEIDGKVFDSKLESQRYLFLKEQQKLGNIYDLQCQVEFELLPNIYKTVTLQLKTKTKEVQKLIQRRVKYTSDFAYYKRDTDEYVVEDTKNGNTFAMSRDWPLRKKMMFFFHKIDVKVVTEATAPI